jgi:hypothetical protein
MVGAHGLTVNFLTKRKHLSRFDLQARHKIQQQLIFLEDAFCLECEKRQTDLAFHLTLYLIKRPFCFSSKMASTMYSAPGASPSCLYSLTDLSPGLHVTLQDKPEQWLKMVS